MIRVLVLRSPADHTGSVKQFDLARPFLGERFEVVAHTLPADVRGLLANAKPDLVHSLGADAFRAVRKLALARVKLPPWLAAGAAGVEPTLGFTPGLTATLSQFEHERDWAARLVPAPKQFSAKVGVSAPTALAGRVHQERHILACGGFDAVANLKHLVWAFDALKYPHPDLRMVILGDGPRRSEVEQFARHLGGGDDRIVCVGHQPDVTPFMGDAVMAWGAHTRGGTKFLLEAMASGVPVIATDTPDARTVITPGASGELVPVDRPVEMAKVAHQLLTDPVRRRARSLAGETAATRYPVADLAEALAGVYDSLTSSASPRPE
jgi:glycosyltransferase involved in cell wall biosynthesis